MTRPCGSHTTPPVIITARLLMALGEEPRAAIERVRRARPGAIETAAQEAYVLACRVVNDG